MTSIFGHILAAIRAIYKKYPKACISLLLVLMLLVATSIRFVLLLNDWPTTNSDEATMGIMTLHIAFHGARPLIFYGQGYMAPLEAYLASPFFLLSGSSLLHLRLGLLLFYGAFLIAMYYHTSVLYSKKFALCICLLLCFGSKEVIIRQLLAVGEYPELPLFAIIICILIVKIVWHSNETSSGKFGRDRKILYFLLGLSIGLAIWVDFLILPFVITGLIMLMLFARKELVSVPGWFLLLGLVIGISPVIFYNITVPFDQSTFASIGGVLNASDGKSYTLIQRIAGAFFIGIPSATGYIHMCAANAFPVLGRADGTCTALQGGWSVGYLTLWTLAVCKAIKNIRRARRELAKTTKELWQKYIIEYGRLMLLISAGMTIILYAFSTSAASVPEPTARYLICLLLSIPAVLWQLWPAKKDDIRVRFSRLSALISLSRVCILLLILCVFVSGVFETFAEIVPAQQFALRQTALVQRLQALGATHIYSEYWTCNRLIFQSNEKIVCSVLNADLSPGLNRYPPYQATVQAYPNPAYVFPSGSPYDQSFAAEQAKSDASQKYRFIKYDGYSIYLPI